MPVRSYPNPGAFKTALDARLQKQAREQGIPFARKRMLLVFDRFLARTAERFADAVVLKGGLALELRLERARTTKDIDLRMHGSAEGLLARLQDAGQLDLGDFMRFEVQPDPDHPEIEDTIDDGFRFRTTCMLAGRAYGDPFGVDIAFGDPILGSPQEFVTPDHLGFIGVAPPSVKVYPVETHIAEKLHAYTKPRPTPNGRVKDLPDLALLATAQPLLATRVRAALRQTFSARSTHEVPNVFPDPPKFWTTPYARIARNDGLPWHRWRSSPPWSGGSSNPCSRATPPCAGRPRRGAGTQPTTTSSPRRRSSPDRSYTRVSAASLADAGSRSCDR